MAAEADGPDSQQAEALDDVCDEALTQLVGMPMMTSLDRSVLRQWTDARPRHVAWLAESGNLVPALKEMAHAAGRAVHTMRSQGVSAEAVQHEARVQLLYFPTEDDVPVLPMRLAPYGQPPPKTEGQRTKTKGRNSDDGVAA